MSNRTVAAALVLPQLIKTLIRHWKFAAVVGALIWGFATHPAAFGLFFHTVFGGA